MAERIRPSVRVEVDSEQVQFVSLENVLTLRGATSVQLWNSLREPLEHGVDTAAILATIDNARTRSVVTAFIESLQRDGLLQHVEPCDQVINEQFSTELRRYVEHRAYRPASVLRRLSELRIEFHGHQTLLETIRALLVSHGLLLSDVDVRDDRGAAPSRFGVLRFGTPSAPAWQISCQSLAGGITAVGPVPATTTPLSDLCEVELALPGSSTGPSTPERLAPDPVLAHLLAAQLLLGCVDTVIDHVDRTRVDVLVDPPSYYVTDAHMVSELHSFVSRTRFDGLVWLRMPVSDVLDSPANAVEDDWSRHVSAVWDAVFGPLADPSPDDLPQSPYGLARIDPPSRHGTPARHGVGESTAAARWDLFVSQMHSEFGIDEFTGLGLSPVHAITDLLLQLCCAESWQLATAENVQIGELPFTVESRWAWARLTIDHGQDPVLTMKRIAEDGAHFFHCTVACGVLVSAWAAVSADDALLCAVERMNAQFALRRATASDSSATALFVCTRGDIDLVKTSYAVLAGPTVALAEDRALGMWFARAEGAHAIS